MKNNIFFSFLLLTLLSYNLSAQDYCLPVFSGGCDFNNLNDFIIQGENETLIEDLETGCAEDAYDDRTDQSIDLFPGGNYSAYMTTEAYGDYAVIWIDFGEGFEKVTSTSEMIDQDEGSDIDIYIPSSVEEGEYRMRVMVGWGGDPDLSSDYSPCNDGSNSRNYGEVHDYTANILSGSSCLSPTDLEVVHIYENKIDLEWTANADEDEWMVVYGEDDFNPNEEGENINVEGNPEATIEDLEANTTYNFYVKAICEEEESSFSNAVKISTLCTPTDVPFTQDFENVSPPALPECGVLETLSGSDWKTAEVNSNGFDSKVLRYTFTFGSNANTWYFTRGVNLNANTAYQISYKYGNDDPTYSEKLRVSYGIAPESEEMENELENHTNIFNGMASTNEITFSVEESGVYYFGFNAHSDSGQSYLFLDDIEIISTAVCEPPTNLDIAEITETSAEISWSGNGENWEIIYGEEGFNPDAEGETISSTNSTVLLENLTPDTSYDIYVRTICEESNSEWIGPENFVTNAEECLAPEDIIISNITDTTADISWTPMGNETEWKVVYYENIDNEESQTVLTTPETTLTNLTPDTVYSIYIIAVCEENNQGISVIENFQTEKDLSVDQDIFKGFSFYPNPVENTLYLEGKNSVDVIKIYNLNGKLILESHPEVSNPQLSVENLSSGVYLMKVEIEGNQKVVQLIKK